MLHPAHKQHVHPAASKGGRRRRPLAAPHLANQLPVVRAVRLALAAGVDTVRGEVLQGRRAEGESSRVLRPHMAHGVPPSCTSRTPVQPHLLEQYPHDACKRRQNNRSGLERAG